MRTHSSTRTHISKYEDTLCARISEHGIRASSSFYICVFVQLHVSSYHYIYYYMYADLEDFAHISEHGIRASSYFYNTCVLVPLYILLHVRGP